MEDKQKKPVKIIVNRADLERMRLQREDTDFIRDSRAALLSKSTPFANVLLFILIIFIATGIVWSRLAKLDELTRGVGKVVPLSQVQIIQNLEGGIASKIFVKEGDNVKSGQILAQLDDTRFAAQYREGYAKYLALQASIARLTAEAENKPQITFPEEVKKDAHLVKRETELFKSRKAALQNTLKNLHHSLRLAEKELNITAPLVKQGVMSEIELLRIKRDVVAIKTKIDAYRDNFHEAVLTDLTKVKADVAVLSETLAALKDRMQRTTIRSPVKGIVKQIYINTVGGVVEPARPIMEVVPLNDKLIIEARIKPNDIAFIKSGQDATVKITAYDYAVYGGLKAKVTHISADTSIDPQGYSYYEVTLKTDKNYLGSKIGSLPIIPGMTASVDIITGKKPILTYLLKPILRAKEKALRER